MTQKKRKPAKPADKGIESTGKLSKGNTPGKPPAKPKPKPKGKEAMPPEFEDVDAAMREIKRLRKRVDYHADISRRNGAKGGRPRKPDSEVSKAALKRRDKRAAEA